VQRTQYSFSYGLRRQYASFEEHGSPAGAQNEYEPEPVVTQLVAPQIEEQHTGLVYGGGTQHSQQAFASGAIARAATNRTIPKKYRPIDPPLWQEVMENVHARL
jgi:hypothetical protein